MFFILKEILWSFSFNFLLFLMLIVGLQNGTSKSKVNILINETVDLPIGFIVGTSFLTGSIFGNIFNLKSIHKK